MASRKQAKRALDTLGEDGRDALQQLQLSSHGFQGISVKWMAKWVEPFFLSLWFCLDSPPIAVPFPAAAGFSPDPPHLKPTAFSSQLTSQLPNRLAIWSSKWYLHPNWKAWLILKFAFRVDSTRRFLNEIEMSKDKKLGSGLNAVPGWNCGQFSLVCWFAFDDDDDDFFFPFS